jgi:predicted neuraminidase
MTVQQKPDPSLQTPKLVFAPVGLEYADRQRVWQGIPSIARTSRGTLWVTFYGGGKREGKGNYVIVVRSDDDGITWSNPQIVITHESAEVRTFDPCIWIDPADRLWVFWSQSSIHYDARLGVWGMHCQDPDAPAPAWSAPERMANGVMLNKPTVLSTGEWLFPCALWACDPPAEDHGLQDEMRSNVFCSTDSGQSLTLLGSADIPDRHYDEHSVLELADGRLWMLVRTRYGIGQSFSHDRGRTWEPGTPTDLGGPDSRFFVGRLNSGRLLMVNHHCASSRTNLRATLSEDDGLTWKGDLLVDGRASVTYPNATEGEDGTLYVVYDRERGREREILLAVFREEDILNCGGETPTPRRRALVNKGAPV